MQSDQRLREIGPMYNIPKNYFLNPELTEITEQTIDELHRHDENAENSENIVEQGVVVNLSLSKEGKVEDEDDVYKPIAVSPDGRFFKYEEEVSIKFGTYSKNERITIIFVSLFVRSVGALSRRFIGGWTRKQGWRLRGASCRRRS